MRVFRSSTPPRGLRAPETRHPDRGYGALQALKSPGLPPGSQRQPGKGGWQTEGEEPAAISHRSIERPGGSSLGPNPAQPAAPAQNPENKIRVWEGGASAAGKTGSAGLQAGEMLRHGANMDAGLLSFFSLEELTSPGAPKSRFLGAETPQSNGNETLGWVGKFPRFFSPSIAKTLQFLLRHQGSD